MEGIKEAFLRVKVDIDNLKKSEEYLKKNLYDTKQNMFDFCEIISKLNNKIDFLDEQNKLLQEKINFLKEQILIQKENKNTEQIINNRQKGINLDSDMRNSPLHKSLDISLDRQTDFPAETGEILNNATDNPADKSIFNPGKDQFPSISMRNEGVQTDKQTDKQTDRQVEFSSHNQEDSIVGNKFITHKLSFKENLEKDVSTQELLESLDNIKKELRLKFKRLTEQELMVFSAIYQLEEEFGYSDYKILSKKLNLSESSIRDYVSRLISKNIPLEKTKINNKEIHLSVPSSLKKVASLNTIINLIGI